MCYTKSTKYNKIKHALFSVRMWKCIYYLFLFAVFYIKQGGESAQEVIKTINFL